MEQSALENNIVQPLECTYGALGISILNESNAFRFPCFVAARNVDLTWKPLALEEDYSAHNIASEQRRSD